MTLTFLSGSTYGLFGACLLAFGSIASLRWPKSYDYGELNELDSKGAAFLAVVGSILLAIAVTCSGAGSRH